MKIFLASLVVVLISTVCTQQGQKANCAAVSCLLPDCPVTKTPPGECCPVCVTPPDTCTYKGKIYQNGETFMRECNKCRCIKGKELCTKKRCVSKPGCRQGKRFYKEGASVPSKNPCESCVCSNSAITCAILDCARPPCEPEFQMVPEGQCCPVCAKPAIIDGYPVS